MTRTARLAGKVAIVTGAGTGIGRETAKMLAAEGAAVVVNGRRSAPIESVVAEIAKAGGRAVARAAGSGGSGRRSRIGVSTSAGSTVVARIP